MPLAHPVSSRRKPPAAPPLRPAKARTPLPLAPTDNVLACIHVVSNRIGRAFYSEVESKHGITLAEWRVVLTLADRPGCTAMEIAALWGLEKMAASRAVARLVARKQVRRLADGSDRRRQPLALTAAGLALYAEVEPDASARYRRILEGLGHGDRDVLLALLHRLIESTDDLR